MIESDLEQGIDPHILKEVERFATEKNIKEIINSNDDLIFDMLKQLIFTIIEDIGTNSEHSALNFKPLPHKLKQLIDFIVYLSDQAMIVYGN